MAAEKTPMERLASARWNASACRQEIAKLRDTRSALKPPPLSAYRENHGNLTFADVQLVQTPALRAFLIQHLEAEALRYDRMANGLRFEVLEWCKALETSTRAEIAAFNSERLK